MLAVEPLLHRVECLRGHPLLQADAGHAAPAVGLDKDLPFFVLFRADFITEIVVGTQEPLPVPAMLLHGLHHPIHMGEDTVSLLSLADSPAELCIVATADHKETGDH